MTDISKLKKGISLDFVGALCIESLAKCAQHGIDCVELSYGIDEFENKYRFAERACEYAEIAAEEGVEIWSLHLPCHHNLDVSSMNIDYRKRAMEAYEKLICGAAAAGLKTIVMHGSGDNVSDEERPERLAYCKSNIALLNKFCQDLKMTFAVENLPRSCLCNTSAEAVELLAASGTAVCFDTNHSLKESSEDFLSNIIAAGLRVGHLHISDYDTTDSMHWLPGDGNINWQKLLGLLENVGYDGPLIYEVRGRRNGGKIILEELAENQQRLVQKLL